MELRVNDLDPKSQRGARKATARAEVEEGRGASASWDTSQGEAGLPARSLHEGLGHPHGLGAIGDGWVGGQVEEAGTARRLATRP